LNFIDIKKWVNIFILSDFPRYCGASFKTLKIFNLFRLQLLFETTEENLTICANIPSILVNLTQFSSLNLKNAAFKRPTNQKKTTAAGSPNKSRQKWASFSLLRPSRTLELHHQKNRQVGKHFQKK
jgi:hypothetical protein